jgi:signal transduction histidine kinase
MSTVQPDPGKYGILYVDDEEQALKYFRRGLEKDFRVLTANGVAPAMALLEQDAGSIAVVITDQRMPGKSGVSLLTEVRQRWPAIVRILITAYTEIDSAVAAVNSGAVYKYINKPADFVLLRQILTDAVALHRETVHRDALAETLRQLVAQRRATEEAEAKRDVLQQQLIAASREAGRAEVATGILHNVGNVLNSMNVAAGVVSNTLEQSRMGNLCKGLAMLEEHSQDLVSFITTDERGQRLPSYLSKLAPVLTEEQTVIANAMASLNRNIEHIVQVVQVQQSHAKSIDMRQPVDPKELMEDALRVNQASIEKHAVQVVRDFEQCPILLLDQHSVLQILINLLSNAVNAVNDANTSDKRVTLTIKVNAGGAAPQICFQVTDTGGGIAPENLTKIFTYGFTTRKEGHGFGLHSAANAAREMGGSLTVSSGGPGQGAAFTLALPISREEDAPAPKGESTGKVSV